MGSGPGLLSPHDTRVSGRKSVAAILRHLRNRAMHVEAAAFESEEVGPRPQPDSRSPSTTDVMLARELGR